MADNKQWRYLRSTSTMFQYTNLLLMLCVAIVTSIDAKPTDDDQAMDQKHLLKVRFEFCYDGHNVQYTSSGKADTWWPNNGQQTFVEGKSLLFSKGIYQFPIFSSKYYCNFLYFVFANLLLVICMQTFLFSCLWRFWEHTTLCDFWHNFYETITLYGFRRTLAKKIETVKHYITIIIILVGILGNLYWRENNSKLFKAKFCVQNAYTVKLHFTRQKSVSPVFFINLLFYLLTALQCQKLTNGYGETRILCNRFVFFNQTKILVKLTLKYLSKDTIRCRKTF